MRGHITKCCLREHALLAEQQHRGLGCPVEVQPAQLLYTLVSFGPKMKKKNSPYKIRFSSQDKKEYS